MQKFDADGTFLTAWGGGEEVGNDTLDGGANTDTCRGGTGTDTACDTTTEVP